MILKSMLKFCTKKRRIEIFFAGNYKYLSDGDMCIYIGDIAPTWDCNDCATALELSDEQLGNFELLDGEPHDNEAFEVEELQKAEMLRYSVNCDGLPLQPFLLPDNKIFFVDLNRMAVFKDVGIKQYYLGYYNDQCALYVATGDFVVGAIAAEKMNLDIMQHFAHQLGRGVNTSVETHFLDVGGQMWL